MKKIAVILTTLLLLAGCAPSDKPTLTRTDLLLDTVITVTLYGDHRQEVLDGAIDLCRQYEELLSRKLEGSEVYALNHASGRPVAVSSETRLLLEHAVHYSALSHGAYDVTIAPVVDLWNFKSEAPSLPHPDAIRRELTNVGYRNIVIQGDEVLLTNGAQIDLGSIAKGYIADRLAAFLAENGVKSAMIDLGGNVLAVGAKPSGAAFSVGIQKPFSTRGELLGTVHIKGKTVVSSGVYERFFRMDGALYHHILDTANGYPVQNGLQSVTIITDSSMEADAMSTTSFVLGLEEGLRLVEQQPDMEAIFVTDDGSLHFTSGFGSGIVFEPQK